MRMTCMRPHSHRAELGLYRARRGLVSLLVLALLLGLWAITRAFP
jgi:hypothetical protein